LKEKQKMLLTRIIGKINPTEEQLKSVEYLLPYFVVLNMH